MGGVIIPAKIMILFILADFFFWFNPSSPTPPPVVVRVCALNLQQVAKKYFSFASMFMSLSSSQIILSPSRLSPCRDLLTDKPAPQMPGDPSRALQLPRARRCQMLPAWGRATRVQGGRLCSDSPAQSLLARPPQEKPREDRREACL